MGNLTALLSKISPAVDEEFETTANRTSANSSFVENVATINLKRTVKSIMERSTILEHMIESGAVGIIGGMHDLSSGKVTYYPDTKFISS